MVCVCVCLNYEGKCYHIARKYSIFSKLTVVICKQHSAVEHCIENVGSQVHQWRHSSSTWETGLDYMWAMHFFRSSIVVHHAGLRSVCHHTLRELGKSLEIETHKETESETQVILNARNAPQECPLYCIQGQLI